jgi:VanZ family protein
MKKIILLVITSLLLVAFASSMTYEQQTIVPELKTLLKNEPFKNVLSKIEVEYWGKTISVEERGYFYFVEFLIRKATHFIGYGIIGVIFYTLYRKLQWRFAPLLAIATVFIIGCIDEFRQYYTPGRTAVFDDVLIDTAGALLFVTITSCLLFLFGKYKGGRRTMR